ncbi:MAG: amidohydrolase family protein, partial [Chloroflexota bacterium]|nr:amidohydrolase family protein [Chloroflexota bacterium]
MSTQAADLVLYNANLMTMNPRCPRAELVAAGAGEIVWVGSNGDLDLFKGHAKLIDCEGKTVIPGFNDAHAHVLGYASRLLGVDCSPASVASISDIESRIRQQAEFIPRGAWIKASGYNEFYLSESRHPTRHDLDRAAPHHPVKLTHRSLHACVLNSQALFLAGISIETPDPPGGLIDRDVETGEPNGILFGMNAYINEQVVPPLSEQEFSHGVKLVNQSFLSSGITSVQDATVRNGIEQWQTFSKLKEKAGTLVPQIRMMLGLHSLDDFKERGLYPGY